MVHYDKLVSVDMHISTIPTAIVFADDVGINRFGLGPVNIFLVVGCLVRPCRVRNPDKRC